MDATGEVSTDTQHTEAYRLDLLERMHTIREVETRLGDLFKANEIPGFIHLSIGQEAVAVGLASALRLSDTCATTHRGHGHAIAKGVDLTRFLLEVMGREGGLCQGRGGSMHVANLAAGMLGANGIVGGGVPIALGSAWAHQVARTGNLAVALFGDGALAEGVLHESINIAVLWSLPVLFVCEHNGWSEFTPSDRGFATDAVRWATGYGVNVQSVDGNDVEAVAAAASRLTAAVRAGSGPRLLECRTHRHRGHFEGDPQRYRTAGELSDLNHQDPIERYRTRLGAAGVPNDAIDNARQRAQMRVNQAMQLARAGRQPQFELALKQTYADAQHD